jgi:hypothetical protein
MLLFRISTDELSLAVDLDIHRGNRKVVGLGRSEWGGIIFTNRLRAREKIGAST